ncbi:MAG: HlyD family efflux transporter periplasmic adaptor subunit [Oscillospiraceae bacterium]
MKFTLTKINLSKKQKAAALCVCALALIALPVFSALTPTKEELPPRRREYTAKKDSIIVGIDATGGITSQRKGEFVPIPLQIKEYTVKVGDRVKSGDVLAIFSAEDIDTKLKAANDKLSADGFAVDKLKADKRNYQLELEKKIGDIRDARAAAFNEKTASITAKKSLLEQTITTKTAQKEQLSAELAALQAQQAGRLETLAQYTKDISALTGENLALQAQIDVLKLDTVNDNSVKIVELEGQKAANEAKISQISLEKLRLETTDFNALLSSLTPQIQQLQVDIDVTNTQLTAAKGELNALTEQHNAACIKDDETVGIIVRQGDAQHALYDSQISQGLAAYALSKEACDELQAFRKDPTIKAGSDGVITALGYKVNGITDSVTPVAELGLCEERRLDLQVDPVDISDISIGQEVSFYVDAYPDLTFLGKVEAKSYLQDEKGKFLVTVTIPQAQEELLDGMGANATLIVKQKLDILTLPNKAILFDEGKSYVFVADELGVLERREITTGFSNGRLTEIISGLNQGDVAVVEERYENS